MNVPKTPRIVVGIDGSEESKDALRWAGLLAGSAAVGIEAVAPISIEAVIAWPNPSLWIGAGWAGVPADWNPGADAEKVLDSTVAEVLGESPATAVELIVQEGGAAGILLGRSAGAEMLVVGSRGHGGFAGLLLGSVSTALVEHATCPVLVVHGNKAPEPREPNGTTPGRVVVGVDGSPASKIALRWAVYLADIVGATVEAVAVWQFPAIWLAGNWAAANSDWKPGNEAQDMLEQTVTEVFGADRPAGLTLTTWEGNAAKVLLDVSDDATALVVGSRGHGGFTGLLLGSVSASCAEHSRGPVLVVHGDTPLPTRSTSAA